MTAANDLGRTVLLVSPTCAPTFAGIGWWRELTGILRATYPTADFATVLDCGPLPGMALAAIRGGVTNIWINTEAATLDRIAAIAEQAGCSVEIGAEVALDLFEAPNPDTACRKALGKDHGDTEAGGVPRGK